MNRQAVVDIVTAALHKKSRAFWLAACEKVGVPCGPVNNLEQVFNDPHLQHRGAEVRMPHPLAGSGEVSLISNPLKLSETPVQYRHAPPIRNQHEQEILRDWLGQH
jgi:crotonobetainyl-CoA:carnitine CoA-transferase CaiB-like acyl-CoA transferase